MSIIAGKALKYGDNINTDDIMNNSHTSICGPGPAEIGKYCLINYDPTFVQRVSQGDSLVVGKNFGCGSSKPAAIALIGAGVECVIAKSFSRLFFRNAINLGLLPVESEWLADNICDGDEIKVDSKHRLCSNITQGWEFPLPAYPDLIWDIIDHKGISNWVKSQFKEG